jgi:DNA-binding transcriptional MerR regulator
MTCVLSIGEFARASGLTAKALRLYDELELLTPAEVDQSNGYRYYAPEQVEEARLVARLRSAGVPLSRIAAIITAPTSGAAANEVLSYWRQVEAERNSAREVITSLVGLLQGQDDTMGNSSALDVSLADLIARLQDQLQGADDLTRVTEARRRARALSDLGDQLVDHYVSEAKRNGASWDGISDALGSIDGGAPQRPTSTAFERFTDLNRHSIVLAQEAARTHRHDRIGTEHLLLGLLSEPRGMAYEVLRAGAGSAQRVRTAIEVAMAPVGETALVGHIAFGPDSKLAIEQALRSSTELGHDWVGTEHTLLGMVRVEDCLAAQILRNLGFTADDLRDTVEAEIDRRLAVNDSEPAESSRSRSATARAAGPRGLGSTPAAPAE